MLFGTQPRDPFGGTATTEALEMLKAWLGMSAAFSILLVREGFPVPQGVVTAAVTAGLGFVLHEMGHRVVARWYGAQARFWANDVGLVIAVLTAFAGFLMAAPGAVWHSGYLTKRQSGLVSAAGPIVNIILAVLFFAGYVVGLRFGYAWHLPRSVLLGLHAGFTINAYLAFFNMLPIGPLDGAKVLNWSVPMFVVLLVTGVALAFGVDKIEVDLVRWILLR